MEEIFYVYAYLDPRKPGNYIYGEYEFNYEPFYIGKGKKDRDKFHLINAFRKKRCNLREKFIRQLVNDCSKDPIILRVKENLSEDESLTLEIDLITLIGRRDLDIGPLVNLTNGGEGTSNRVYTEETKRKISLNHADFSGSNHPRYGKTLSEETKKKIGLKSSQKVHSEETKKKISEKLKGRVFSEEHKRNIGIGNKGCQKFLGKKHTKETLEKRSRTRQLNKLQNSIDLTNHCEQN